MSKEKYECEWVEMNCERLWKSAKFVWEIVECLYFDSSDQSYVTNDNRTLFFVKTESIQSDYIREPAKE